MNIDYMSDKLVIIPTFNEVENITSIIQSVFSLEERFDVLVVDDNSPDGTAKEVTNLQKTFPDQLFLEVRKEKDGLGKAYAHGFKWALDNKYKYIFEMDADFSHNPKDLIKLQAVLNNGADVAIGSRYCKGVNVVNWPMSRVLLSYFASKYVKVITRLPVHDSTAGFVGYKSNVLENLDFDKIKFRGYGFQIEMKYKAWKKGYNLKEVAIIFTDRAAGESKMNASIIGEAIWGVIILRLRSICGKL